MTKVIEPQDHIAEVGKKVRSHETSCMYCRHLAETSEKEPCNWCLGGDKFEPKVEIQEQFKEAREQLQKVKTLDEKIQQLDKILRNKVCRMCSDNKCRGSGKKHSQDCYTRKNIIRLLSGN